VFVDGAHRQGSLDAHEGPQAGVPGLQFHRGQPVFHRAATGAAVALEVHAEQPEITHLCGDLAGEYRVLIPAGDVRDDPALHEFPHQISQSQLVGGEQRVQVQVVTCKVADVGFNSADGRFNGGGHRKISW
jgi:hypothetical protein